MQPIDFTFISVLAGSTTARACRLCRRPIYLDDEFGLAEHVCRACMIRPAAAAPPRRLVTWLRRAA